MTALAMKQTGLKPAAKIVLYWLADHHNSETGKCFPSLNTLADECEMTRPTVVRHLQDLEALGLIEKSQRTRENGSQTSSSYILTFNEIGCKDFKPPLLKNLTGPLLKNETPITLEDTNLGTEQEAASVDADLFSGTFEQEAPKKSDGLALEIEEGFREFWYEIWPSSPRKKPIAKCRALYEKTCRGKHPAKKSAIIPKVLNDAARRYISSVKDPQFIMGTHKWLNEPGWEPFLEGPDAVVRPDWSGLSKSQRNLLEQGKCPPSMCVDGRPNKTAVMLYATLAISKTRELVV